MKVLLSSLGFLIVVISVLLVLLFVFQRKLIYPAPPFDMPATLPADVLKLDFASGYLLFLPARSSIEKAPVIIFAHGNGEVAFQWVEEFQLLRDAGVAVALVEYPSYAGAPGKPSMDAIRTVMNDAYDTVVARDDVDAAKVISYGRSIGGGAACLLLKERPVVAVVLESTFSRLAKLVREKYYPSFMLLDRYDNAGILASSNVPVFLYHGTQDRVIPLHHAKILHQAAKHSTLEIAECDHNSCARPEPQVLAFLRQWNIL